MTSTPDHHGQDADQVDVVGRAGDGEGGDAGGEERRDGGVGAHRHLRVGAEQREEHGAGDERVEPGDRRHPGQPGGRQLLGHRDDEERDAGRQVGARPGALVAVERREDPGPSHRDIIADAGVGRIDRIDAIE